MPGEMMPYLLAMVIFMVGIYAIVAKKNIIKIIIGVICAEYAVNLFLILVGYRHRGIAPIRTPELDAAIGKAAFVERAVDPLPQALILTSIVIGLGLVALMVAVAIRLYEKYGTFDISEIKRLKG